MISFTVFAFFVLRLDFPLLFGGKNLLVITRNASNVSDASFDSGDNASAIIPATIQPEKLLFLLLILFLALEMDSLLFAAEKLNQGNHFADNKAGDAVVTTTTEIEGDGKRNVGELVKRGKENACKMTGKNE